MPTKSDEKAEDASEAKAIADCKEQQAADAAKFAAKYKNLGQCVKAQKERRLERGYQIGYQEGRLSGRPSTFLACVPIASRLPGLDSNQQPSG